MLCFSPKARVPVVSNFVMVPWKLFCSEWHSHCLTEIWAKSWWLLLYLLELVTGSAHFGVGSVRISQALVVHEVMSFLGCWCPRVCQGACEAQTGVILSPTAVLWLSKAQGPAHGKSDFPLQSCPSRDKDTYPASIALFSMLALLLAPLVACKTSLCLPLTGYFYSRAITVRLMLV